MGRLSILSCKPTLGTRDLLLLVFAVLLFAGLNCTIGETQGGTDQSLIETQTALQVQQTLQAKNSSQSKQTTQQAQQETRVAQIVQGTQLAQQSTQLAQQATRLAQPIIPTIQVTKPPTPEPLPTKKTGLPPQPPSGSSNNSGTIITLKVSNNTSRQAICFLYAAPSNSATWGNDLLGSNTTIQPGYWVSFNIYPNGYDLRADDCDGNTLATKYDVAIYKNYTWTLTGGSPASFCGDGTCGPYDENALNCPGDCGSCGDGICGNDEQCAEDCGSGGPPVNESFCGDGTCGPYDENALNCPGDCGFCGDGICGNDEQCAEDCGSGGPPVDDSTCGDGVCQLYEDEYSCAVDCYN